MNIRGLNTTNGGSIGCYVSRAQYLLAIGRPAAQVAYFHPTDSMWLGDEESDDCWPPLKHRDPVAGTSD